MSDVAMAPEAGAGEPVTVITPAADLGTDLSIRQAAQALAAARHKPKEQPAESAEPATAEPELVVETNTDPVEEPILGEDAPEIDPAEVPPIEPPRSWTKEAKDRWQSLPRETQEYLSTREQERDREVRRSQNEAAEQRKAFEADRQKVEHARQQYEARLPELMQALQDANAANFSDIRTMDDVKRMAAEDPFRKIQWDAHQQALQAANWEMQQTQQRQAEERQTKRTEYSREQSEKLIELIPEMKDPEKANQLRTKAVTMLVKDYGFSEGDLSAIMQSDEGHRLLNDARWQKLIADGMKYAEIKKASKDAVKKPVPPVLRPGVSRPAGAQASEEIQALTRKLEQSGSLKDAQALRAAQARLAQRRAS